MYSEHFSLEENPFSIAPDPRYLYMSEKHREALAHLLYGLETDGGFVLLTGEVGTGKTTVCRCLLEQLPENIDIALVLNPKLTSLELLATICDELGIEHPADNTSIKSLIDKINKYLLENHAAGRKTVLIIDEAQNLDAEVLEQLRLLTNLETNQRKLLQVVILGQPELRDKLARTELRQLAQRITARFHLGPLEKKEVGPYITHRLSVAGHRKKIFSDKVVNKIYEMTGGIPRLINVLCDRCLLGTYAQGREKVNHPTLKQAATEVFGKEKKRLFSSTASMWLLIIAATSAVAIALNFGHLSSLLNKRMTDAPGTVQETTVIDTPAVAPPAEEPVTEKASVGILPPEDPALSELVWPDDTPRGKSRALGFMELFLLWGKEYDPASDLSPCQQAKNAGLSCLDRKGSLGGMVHLDRPALLRMIDSQGLEFYAALVKLVDNRATFIINGNKEVRDVSVLDRQWFGSYTILWQPPPDFKETIKPGSDEESQWLREKMAAIRNEDTGTAELGPLVREFQRREGLVADGLVGPETIIHINTGTGSSGPRLTGN